MCAELLYHQLTYIIHTTFLDYTVEVGCSNCLAPNQCYALAIHRRFAVLDGQFILGAPAVVPKCRIEPRPSIATCFWSPSRRINRKALHTVQERFGVLFALGLQKGFKLLVGAVPVFVVYQYSSQLSFFRTSCVCQIQSLNSSSVTFSAHNSSHSGVLPTARTSLVACGSFCMSPKGWC